MSRERKGFGWVFYSLVVAGFFFISIEAVPVGVILLVLGIMALILSFGGSTDSDNTPETKAAKPKSTRPESAKEGGAEVKVISCMEDFNGLSVPVFKFQLRGRLSGSRRVSEPHFELRMLDVTDGNSGEDQTVFNLREELQDHSSMEFLWGSTLDAIPAGARLAEWMSIAVIPKEFFIFPRKGRRRIKTRFRLRQGRGGRLLTEAESINVLTVDLPGYLEIQEEETEAQKATLMIAIAIAAVDGRIDEAEIETIKDWGERVVNSLPEKKKAERRYQLNEVIRESLQAIREKRGKELEKDALAVLRNIRINRFQYNAYELCVRVAGADGEAHPKELERLENLSGELRLDRNRIRALNDRYFFSAKLFDAASDAEEDRFLGITKEMGKEEIRSHLNELYRKHGSRTQHNDPVIAAGARDWIKRIADARVRHLT